jgi:hypothetical protein
MPVNDTIRPHDATIRNRFLKWAADRGTHDVIGFRGIGIASRQAALLHPLPLDHLEGHTQEVTNANEKQSPYRLEVACPPFGAYWTREMFPEAPRTASPVRITAS